MDPKKDTCIFICHDYGSLIHIVHYSEEFKKKTGQTCFIESTLKKTPGYFDQDIYTFVIFGLVLDTKASKLTKVKIKKTAHFLSGCIFSQFFPRSLHRFRCRYLNVKIYCTYLFFNFLVKLCYKVVYLGKIIMSNIAPPLLLFH